MNFARWVFLVAGWLGILALAPLYFLERTVGLVQPPEINHPEFYYGFAGVCLAWQVGFVIIGRDPIRYRPMMIPAMLEKATFSGGLFVLIAAGRTSPLMFGPALVDLTLGVFFVMAYAKTKPAESGV